MLFALMFPAAIGGFALWLGAGNVWHSYASRNWPRTAGKVVQSDTSEESSTDRKTKITSISYVANLAFEYEVDGKKYSTPNLYFGQTVGSTDSSEAELRTLRYPAGAPVTVSYKPDDPATAAVKPGLYPDVLWLPGFGLGFLLR
jgi:hypothetical protein